jgi:hypothetical protein
MYRALGQEQQAGELNSECRDLIRDLPREVVESDPDLVEIMKHIR